MTETQSYPLDLIRCPNTKKKYNNLWSDSDLNGSAKFQIVVSDDCPDNIDDCVNKSTGLFKTGFTTTVLGDIKLKLTEYDDYNSAIEVYETATYTLANDLDVKGLFLQKKANNFVFAYMINQRPMRFCDKLIIEENSNLFIMSG